MQRLSEAEVEESVRRYCDSALAGVMVSGPREAEDVVKAAARKHLAEIGVQAYMLEVRGVDTGYAIRVRLKE